MEKKETVKDTLKHLYVKVDKEVLQSMLGSLKKRPELEKEITVKEEEIETVTFHLNEL